MWTFCLLDEPFSADARIGKGLGRGGNCGLSTHAEAPAETYPFTSVVSLVSLVKWDSIRWWWGKREAKGMRQNVREDSKQFSQVPKGSAFFWWFLNNTPQEHMCESSKETKQLLVLWSVSYKSVPLVGHPKIPSRRLKASFLHQTLCPGGYNILDLDMEMWIGGRTFKSIKFFMTPAKVSTRLSSTLFLLPS